MNERLFHYRVKTYSSLFKPMTREKFDVKIALAFFDPAKEVSVRPEEKLETSHSAKESGACLVPLV